VARLESLRLKVLLAALIAAAPAVGPAFAHPPAAPLPGLRDSVLRGASVVPFRLTDQDRRRFELAGLRGRPTLIAFFYAGCTEACPLLVARLSRLRSEMSAAQRAAVQILLITVDPLRDDPPALKAYAERLGVDGGWTFLTGEPREIVDVAKQFQVLFRQGPDRTIDHTAAVYLLDGELAVRAVYPVEGFSTREVLHDLSFLLGTHK
jgi:protein SCO1/2